MRSGAAVTDQLGREIASQFTSHGGRAGRGFGSSFGGELTRSIPGVSGFTSMLSGYQGVAGKAGAVAGRALGLAFTTAAAGLIGAAGYTLFKGFERYQAIDAATNRLQNLNRTMQATGRAGFDVQQVMDTVNKSILDTPFAMDQAFSIATRALASNTGDLQRFMTVVSDAAGFAGAGIDEIGEAFLKVANKGKVSMEEIGNELRNLPILPWLQEQLGVTGAELSKLISDGKVGLEDLLRAVETNASGFAKASGDTVAGAMSNMQTAVARLGANFLGAIFGKPTEDANDLVQVLKTVRDRLDDVNAWVTAHQDDIKRTFEQGVQAAKDLASAGQTILGVLDKIGIGVDDVVTAFVAWKSIQGVSALSTQLGGISTTLATTLPSSAEKGAAGISAALSRIAVPLWLTTLIEDKYPNFPIQDQPAGEDRLFPGWVPLLPFWEDRFRDWTGGPDAPPGIPTGPAGPPRPVTIEDMFGLNPPIVGFPGGLGGGPGAQRERRGGVTGPGGPAPAGSPILPPSGADGDSSGAARLPSAPAVPYAGIPALAPGLQQTAALFSAQTSVADATTRLAEKEARVLQLRADNNATADDILNAENDAAKARREKQEADIRFAEAQQNAFEQQNKRLRQATSELGDFGAALDADFGISDGLAGIAENLTRFLGNIIAAPALMQLQAIAGANPNEGSGLMGVLAANGVLGPQFTPAAIAGYGASGMGPEALRPSYGGYFSDAALLANVPAGRYTQSERGDLTQGLADCSSAIEDLVNLMDGRPTTGASMSTHNAAEWLTARGFLPGSMPGAFNVGFNSGHMQATLPGGTPFNWGSASAAANRGIGGTGAFDPAFTSHFYRPVGNTATAPSIPLYSAANTNPALTPASTSPLPPLPPSIPSGAAGGPLRTGFPQGLTPLGDQPYPAQGGEGIGVSGMAMDALMAGTGVADMMMPGAGALAKIGIQLANRGIKYAGQNVGILASGFLDTITPAGENAKASIGNSWFGKILGGIASAKPAIPNIAGNKGQQALAPGAGGQQGQGQAGNTINQTLNLTNSHATEDMAGNQMVREAAAMWSPAGKQ